MAGFQELTIAETGHLIGAITLSQLRLTLAELTKVKPSFFSKFPAWLGGKEQYIVVLESSGGLNGVLVEATSEEEGVAQVMGQNSSAKVLWVALVAPLVKLKKELEDILMNEDYKRIDFDRRPKDPAVGHPWDWLLYMKRPKLHMVAEEGREYFKNHPEQWEVARQQCLEDYKNGSGPICEEGPLDS